MNPLRAAALILALIVPLSDVMNRLDAERAGLNWHDDFPVWLDEALRREDISYSSLTLEKFRKISAAIITSTPLRMAECLFRWPPEHGGKPWRFLDYQRPIVNWTGSLVLKGAAGTGKTSDIAAKGLHKLAFGKGSVAYAANSSTARGEVWDVILYQISRSRTLRDLFPRDRIVKSFPRKIEGPHGNKFHFYVADQDGEIFRGLHIGNGFLFADEAAAWPEGAWAEWFRRKEGTTPVCLYSVPNGDHHTTFARLFESATPLEVLLEKKERGEPVDHGHFARARWTRPMMGPPYWTKAEEKRLTLEYGGQHTPGYQRNVLALDGNPEGVVFPWGRLKKCFVHVPEYRVVRVAFDDDQGIVRTSVSVASDPSKGEPLEEIQSGEFPLADFDLPSFVGDYLPALTSVAVAGADFGLKTDPTEILFFEERGENLRLVARISLRGATPDKQRALFVAIEKGEVYTRPEKGWGLEASGASLGAAVEAEFRAHCPDSAHRIVGYDWRSQRPLIDPVTQKPLKDKSGRVRNRSAKEEATVLLEERVDSASLEMHRDPRLVKEWSSHAAHPGQNGRVFGNKNDHTIEAARGAELVFEDGIAEPYPIGPGAATSGRGLLIDGPTTLVERLRQRRHA